MKRPKQTLFLVASLVTLTIVVADGQGQGTRGGGHGSTDQAGSFSCAAGF
jgi:hypothetical protein